MDVEVQDEEEAGVAREDVERSVPSYEHPEGKRFHEQILKALRKPLVTGMNLRGAPPPVPQSLSRLLPKQTGML